MFSWIIIPLEKPKAEKQRNANDINKKLAVQWLNQALWNKPWIFERRICVHFLVVLCDKILLIYWRYFDPYPCASDRSAILGRRECHKVITDDAQDRADSAVAPAERSDAGDRRPAQRLLLDWKNGLAFAPSLHFDIVHPNVQHLNTQSKSQGHVGIHLDVHVLR